MTKGQSFSMATPHNAGHLANDKRSIDNVLKKYYSSRSDYEMDHLSPAVQKRVEALKKLQRGYNEVGAEFLKEKAALQAKYQRIYQPSYSERYEIVNGLVEVEIVPVEDTEMEADREKGIPNFWLTVMKKNEVVAAEIFERDEKALGYLNDIKWSKMDNPKGFKLEFCFDTNPYFENSVLTKFYQMVDEEDPTLDKAIGTEIKWHPGKCLALNIDQEGDIASRIKDHISFFDFFNPPPAPTYQSDIDDHTAEKLQKQEEQDYYVGAVIRDKIIPHAVSWFTGGARDDAYNPSDDEDNKIYSQLISLHDGERTQ